MSQVLETKPIAQRVLLKLDTSHNKNKLGLEIPDIKNSLIQVGTVVQKGLGRIGKTGKRVPMEIEIGDRVVIKKFAGVEIRLDGEDYLMVMYDDIEGLAAWN